MVNRSVPQLDVTPRLFVSAPNSLSVIMRTAVVLIVIFDMVKPPRWS